MSQLQSDFLPVSGQFRLNFNAHSIYSLMEDRITSLNDLFTASAKRLGFSYFPSKYHREFEFSMIAREISKSYFFVIFCKQQRKFTQ